MKRTTKAKTIQAPAPTDAYLSFLQRKAAIAPAAGFEPTLQLNAHLFPFQRDVVTWALRRGRAALFEDCGMGKSLQQLEWARHVVDRTGKPVLILTPLAVAAQTEREAARFGIDAMVVMDASDVVRPTICITNYEKLHKFQPDAFGGVVLDECFAPGTMVDVVARDGTVGQSPIEEIRVGHRIINASGIDVVSDVHRREVPYAVVVKVNGRSITCSPNHPFFTQRGWVGAQDIEPGDCVLEAGEAMRMVRDGVPSEVAGAERRSVLREILLSEMADAPAGCSGQGALAGGSDEARGQQGEVAPVGVAEGHGRDRADTGAEPVDAARGGSEDLPPIESHEARTFRAWGQWSRDDQASADAAGCAWTNMGSGVSLVVGPTDSGLSHALQARLGERRAASVHRGGWVLPRQQEGSGRQEGCQTGFSRVEGLEVLQPGNPELDRFRSADGKLYFYDLGGTRHPSFSVGGLLVHNSSILKSYDGKTRTAIVESFRRTPYRLACTATPAPNDHEELGNHAEFLGVMSRTEMLASFFCHDGGETQVWRLKGHAERIFWQWVASWAVSLRSPEDLGYPADGYALPAMAIHRHLLPLDGFSADRGLLFETGDGFGLSERRGARRASLDARVAQVAALVAAEPDEPWLIWCGLNAEGDALTRAIPGAVQVAGSDDADTKAKRMLGFSDGSVRVLITKAGIAGFGMNWQHCARMVFAGMDDSYESFYQAVRRCFRFGQQREVRVHIVASEPESVVIDNVLRKERDHKAMLSAMAEHARSVQVANVRGIARETDPYNPTRKMIVPAWLCSDSEVA